MVKSLSYDALLLLGHASDSTIPPQSVIIIYYAISHCSVVQGLDFSISTRDVQDFFNPQLTRPAQLKATAWVRVLPHRSSCVEACTGSCLGSQNMEATSRSCREFTFSQ